MTDGYKPRGDGGPDPGCLITGEATAALVSESQNNGDQRKKRDGPACVLQKYQAISGQVKTKIVRGQEVEFSGKAVNFPQGHAVLLGDIIARTTKNRALLDSKQSFHNSS